MSDPSAIDYGVTALTGLMVGSFLNVVVHRLPIMMAREDAEAAGEPGGAGVPKPAGRYDLAWPPSQCPHCARPIRLVENIPLLGYAFLKGRCAGCRGPIKLRYPIMEALGALVAVGFLMRFGITETAGAAVLFGWWALAIAAIDLDTFLIPDRLSLPLLWLGLLISVTGATVPPDAAILGAAAGYGLFFLIARLGGHLAGRPVLGFGDVKLFAAIGAWLGWAQLPLVLVVAGSAGSVIGLGLIAFGRLSRRDPLPFGPFLLVAALGVMGAGPWIP